VGKGTSPTQMLFILACLVLLQSIASLKVSCPTKSQEVEKTFFDFVTQFSPKIPQITVCGVFLSEANFPDANEVYQDCLESLRLPLNVFQRAKQLSANDYKNEQVEAIFENFLDKVYAEECRRIKIQMNEGDDEPVQGHIYEIQVESFKSVKNFIKEKGFINKKKNVKFGHAVFASICGILFFVTFFVVFYLRDRYPLSANENENEINFTPVSPMKLVVV
jgi:hypothetical protein